MVKHHAKKEKRRYKHKLFKLKEEPEVENTISSSSDLSLIQIKGNRKTLTFTERETYVRLKDKFTDFKIRQESSDLENRLKYSSNHTKHLCLETTKSEGFTTS